MHRSKRYSTPLHRIFYTILLFLLNVNSSHGLQSAYFFFFHIYFKHHQHSPQSACSSHSFTRIKSICIANHNHANEQIYSHRTVMKHTHMRYSWPMTTVDSRSLALWIHTHLNRMDLVWHRRIAKHTYAQTRKNFITIGQLWFRSSGCWFHYTFQRSFFGDFLLIYHSFMHICIFRKSTMWFQFGKKKNKHRHKRV